MKRVVVISAVLFGSLLGAQYPGQVPIGSPGQYPPGQYPPGQYPPGQNPGNTGGISFPGRKHKKDQKQQQTQAQPTISAEGLTVSNDGQKLIVVVKDGRTLTMTITPQTKWARAGADIPASKVIPRTTVKVEAAEDDEAFLTVTSVEYLKDAPVEVPEGDRPARARIAGAATDNDEDMARPTILQTPEAPNRPVLRHGASKKSASPNDPDTDDNDVQSASAAGASKPATSASVKPKLPPSDPNDFTIDGETAQVKARASANAELIDRTKDWATTFTSGLPNFLCQQMTTRYYQQSRSSGWEPIDVVTAKVLYEDGREKYSEITVGGRRTNKSMMELGGSTSTGEFASVLGGLFTEGSRAEFKLYQSTTVAGQAAAIYDFKVVLARSNWTITVGGQTLRPAYSGSVWIDKASAQVRRIEMQADNVPKDFPEDAIESAVDYEEVSLGTTKFLLPTHAENLSCQRGSPICTKNSIDFRDYHKYTGESTIEFK